MAARGKNYYERHVFSAQHQSHRKTIINAYQGQIFSEPPPDGAEFFYIAFRKIYV